MMTIKDEVATLKHGDFADTYKVPRLTDEQIQEIAFVAVRDNWDWLQFARAIEAKVRGQK